jgi:hypothetical protein
MHPALQAIGLTREQVQALTASCRPVAAVRPRPITSHHDRRIYMRRYYRLRLIQRRACQRASMRHRRASAKTICQ